MLCWGYGPCHLRMLKMPQSKSVKTDCCSYEPEVFPEGSDLLCAWKWAPDHQAEAADINIVSRAKALADMQFSELSQMCYTVCLFHDYSTLMTDRKSIPELISYMRKSNRISYDTGSSACAGVCVCCCIYANDFRLILSSKCWAHCY